MLSFDEFLAFAFSYLLKEVKQNDLIQITKNISRLERLKSSAARRYTPLLNYSYIMRSGSS